MRNGVASTLLGLIATPAFAQVNERTSNLDYHALPLICDPSFAEPIAPRKPTLLEDERAGQLIANRVLRARESLPNAAAAARTESDLVASATNICPPADLPPATGPKISVVIPSQLPVAAARLSSRFGPRLHPLLGRMRMHSGIDLAAPAGSPIVSTFDGKVTSAGWAGGYGLQVVLTHRRGTQTRYGHMSRLNVVAGQRVRKGEIIGFVGSTGRSTGPHVHYEVRVNGQAVNPQRAKR